MQYNDLLLLGMGIVGILLHNLKKINELIKAGKEFNAAAYFKVEWASMCIAVLVVIVAVICKKEVKQLEAAGQWLGLGFVCLGYMGQSVMVTFMGKAAEKLGVSDKDNGTTNV